MYRSECAAGPTVRGKKYHMHGEGCQAKWWPNTGCFLSRGHKLYFSTCGQGRPQSTKHSLGICLPLGTTSIRPIVNGHGKYVQNWHSLDSRPLPGWFDDAKFGIFIHWGVYAVPATGPQAEWYEWALQPENALWRQAAGHTNTPALHAQRYGPGFPYKRFAKMFKAKKFDAKRWAELFHAAGAKYVVLTAKHHDGFCLWPSKYCKWNSKKTGPRKDIVGELAAATRAKNLKFGVYHSLFEFVHPLYVQDRNNQFRTNKFARKKTIPELHELVHRYKPSVVWSDGDSGLEQHGAGVPVPSPDTYWTSKKFLAWLYNVSPVKDEVVVNDRWGGPPPLPGGTRMRHGDFFTGADEQAASASLMRHKWESAIRMDPTSWAFSKNTPPQNYPSGRHFKTVAYGGNLLLNVGPSATGIIPAVFQQRLKVIGAYLRINGEGIYQTRACWEAQEERHIEGFYTAKPDEKVAYLHVVPKSGRWPRPGSVLHLTGVRSAETVQLLTADGPVDVDCKTPRGVAHVHCKTPSRHGMKKGAVHWNAFALKLTGAAMQMNWNR
eukprot:g9316.t1